MCWRARGGRFGAHSLGYRHARDVDIDRADRAADRDEVNRLIFAERRRSPRRIGGSEKWEKVLGQNPLSREPVSQIAPQIASLESRSDAPCFQSLADFAGLRCKRRLNLGGRARWS